MGPFAPSVRAVAVLSLSVLIGCAEPGGERPAAEPASVPPQVAPPSTVDAPSAGPLVVFLGDSLTAGLGVDEDDSFPARLGRRLASAGRPVRVVNAGVSGDTTAGGRARVAWLLRQQPDVVVVELGANDGLRGLALEETEDNLRAILEAVAESGARVLLVGMKLPPNYGPDYTRGFEQIFPRLAEELDIPLVPFLLDGVAGDPELNQADGIHPTAAGHSIMAANVLPYLAQLLDRGTGRPAPA